MPIRDLLSLAAPYRHRLVLLSLLSLAASLAILAVPWLGGQLVGGIITSSGGGTATVIGLLFLALLANALLNFAMNYFSGAVAGKLLADLRQRVYAHVQSLPVAYHEAHRQGDTLAIMTYELVHLSEFLTGTLAKFPSQVLTAAGAAILMFQIDHALGLLVPVLVPVFYFILKVAGRHQRRLAQAFQKAEVDVISTAEENLGMLPAIKAFAREQSLAKAYGARVTASMGLFLRLSRITAALEPAIALVTASGAIGLILLASHSVQSGAMTPKELLSLLFYAALLTRPIGALASSYGQMQLTRGTLARLHAMLQRAPEPGYSAMGRLEESRSHICFRDITFGYPGRGDVLRGLNLDIQPGEVIALVGENGAGKTTAINLLLRFHNPAKGTILLDGHDIAGIQVQDLRRQIGMVPQRPLLFNGTIRANIAFGLDEPRDHEIEAAARLAQAHEFIIRLPLGYQTEIGDHGVRLSGGQRQRIALARALLMNPPILVLDEATSMYDLEGENAFIEACATALAGRTVILITHRPASLALANRMVRIEDGQACEVENPQPPVRGAI
jgi:ATP-binding cassette subfamily B protein/subfamily B ATP-binding cassette protein MsbA